MRTAGDAPGHHSNAVTRCYGGPKTPPEFRTNVYKYDGQKGKQDGTSANGGHTFVTYTYKFTCTPSGTLKCPCSVVMTTYGHFNGHSQSIPVHVCMTGEGRKVQSHWL